jgi:hypothetical protein
MQAITVRTRRLDTRQRRAAVRERAQQHENAGAHHKAVAVLHRHRTDDVLRIVDRESPEDLADNPRHDRQRQHDGEEVRRHRERPSGLAQPAKVHIAHHEHHGDGDLGAVGAERPYRRHNGHGARRDLHRDGNHVVDEQRGGGYLCHPGAEVLPGHHIGAAGTGVGHHHLPVGRGDQNQDEQDHTGDRQEKGERGEPGVR